MRTIRRFADAIIVYGIVLLPVYVLVWAVIVAIRWSDFRGSHLISGERYATTEGMVVSSEMVRRGRGDAYHIEYEFKVDRKSYRNQQISFGYKGGSYKYALGYVAKYRVGKKVTVFYDRTEPGFSVLEPRMRTDFLTPLWVPFLPFALSCAVVLFLPHRSHK
jgi:hypothetical protein